MSELSKVKRIVFWQPNVGVHSLPFFKSLSQYFELKFCVIDTISKRRKDMGWTTSSLSQVTPLILDKSDKKNINKFDEIDNTDTLHIFSGIGAYKPIDKLIKHANNKGAIFAIVSETKDWRGIKGLIRRFVSSYESIELKKNVAFILAIGELGKNWFNSVGYPKEKIFEWAYFTENNIFGIEDSAKENEIIKFVFVGRFIKIKGIDWLLKTFTFLKTFKFELHLIGDGPEFEKLSKQYKETLSEKVIFHGALAPEVVRDTIKNMDYLILPSVGKDGWGAVVNEALSQGVAVIVSEFAGASTMVKDKQIGFTINPENRSSLFKVLKDVLTENRKISNGQRLKIKQHAENVTGQKGAEYFLEILKAVDEGNYSLNPPWRP